ncbi:MAG TPA: zinc ribbon domain-containing protein [bacterium]|nr:zinc ribbon domain-containing protein [bacterium]
MRCPNCGHENAHGKIVCVRCGTRLRAGAAAGPQHDPAQFMKYLRADLVRIAIVTIVVVAVAAFLGFSIP